jgi:beta-lactam-binding protein with PASTA domain
VPPEARGAKPRVDGQLLITIKSGQVSISGITVEISNVVGATLEPAKQCIQQKALGVTVPQVDEEDLENYPIQLSYALP